MEEAGEVDLGREFQDAYCLLDSEVELILNKRKEQSAQFVDDYKLSDAFEKTLSHVKKFSKYKSKSAVQEVRSLLESKGKFTSFEIASLANLNLLTIGEAKALIPSLRRKVELSEELDDNDEIRNDCITEEELLKVLEELQNCSQSFN